MLVLTASNTYAGGTIISDGSLTVSSDSNLGGNGGIAIGPATLHIAGGYASARNITLADPAATIQVHPPYTYTAGSGAVVSGMGA